MSTRTNTLLVAVASVASGAMFAQPELELASTDPETQLVERIAEAAAEGGPTPVSAIEPLRDLALLYEEGGDHSRAIAALEDARHVTRVHRGLFSVDEALLLRQLIRNEEARGNHERVWNLEQSMVRLARQHLDDIRVLPIFRELADDRANVLREYRAGMLPPEIYLGCYYSPVRRTYDYDDPVGGCRSGSKSVVIWRIRSEILRYYADAIEVIVRNGDYASQELRDLEKQALRVATFPPFGPRCSGRTFNELLASELVGGCLEPVIQLGEAAFANVGGSVSLLRLIAYEIRSAAPAAARANAVAELADWHLLVAHNDGRSFGEIDERALAFYELAYRELHRDGDVRASTAQIFAPELPVTLPTFALNPFATPESSRYVDVAFAVTKYGKGERIEILATSKNATRAEQRDLIRLIEGTSFRPRVVAGELAAAAPVVLRYHLGP